MGNTLFPLSALMLFGTFTSCNTGKVSTEEKKKPNILFLFADDQRADAMRCAGNTYIRTPNIDKLAENGVRFTSNYVMGGHHGAICAPSRAMLMSGKSLFHVYDHLDGIHTMPMHFAENGYETFGTGKWHNTVKTFEASFQKGENVFIGGMADHYQVPCRNMGPDRKLSEPVKKGFSTDLFADAAISYLDNYAKGERKNPFFCYVAFTAPHDPRSPRKDYIGMYPDGSIPLPGNFKALHPFEFDDLNIRDETLAPWPRTPEIVQQSLSDYYALISHLDNRIGDIIETLKKQGLFENTIVVYAADNGLAIGSHGLMGKQDLYEHSMKVPLIISGPGIPKNEVRDALVYLYDIFPTLSDICGLPAPNGIDGKDLVPVIMGKEKEVRSSLYTAYKNTVRAVRIDEWKLIRYPQRDFTQLFNLKNDPLEIDNLAVLPEYKSKVDELLALMNEWHTLTNDTATMNPKTILPLEYDYKKLKQVPDNQQPEYVLKKYFKGIDLKSLKKSEH
ncbi:MAG: sulfatase-like hydrolase/transferase [Lentimicrobiaceae bacterium]|nr:sulfatase-like hydrolase/transferase [Lentimicrobiaceae bacterium]